MKDQKTRSPSTLTILNSTISICRDAMLLWIVIAIVSTASLAMSLWNGRLSVTLILLAFAPYCIWNAVKAKRSLDDAYAMRERTMRP